MMTEKFKASGTRDVCLNYITITPKDHDPEKESLPLIVSLHGAGERKDDPTVLMKYGPCKYFSTDPEYKGIRTVILAPQIITEDITWNNITDELMELIEQTVERYNIDRDRITMTGVSMGGFGTWEMGILYPDYFAALAPVCGGGMSWRAERIGFAGVPVRTFHGDCDTLVPPIYSKLMVDAVNNAGGNATLRMYEGVAHEVWHPVYDDSDVFEWLYSQSKKDRK